MTQLKAYLDAANKGVWANIRMDNNDPCWVGVAETGVLVKKSKIGLFGKKLYEKRIVDSANTALALNKKFSNDLTPQAMRHPLLKSFTNAILHCSTIYDVTMLLNAEYPEPDFVELTIFLRPGTIPSN